MSGFVMQERASQLLHSCWRSRLASVRYTVSFDESDVASNAFEIRWRRLLWVQEIDKIGVSVAIVDANANVARFVVKDISKALDTWEALKTAILSSNARH